MRASLRWVLAISLLAGCDTVGDALGGDEGGSGEGDLPEGSGNPQFPGGGTGDSAGAIPGSHIFCFFSPDFPDGPAASVEYVFEQLGGADTVRVRLIFHPGFVDNTYGVNAIGWGRHGHTFQMLERSDHAIILLRAGGSDVLGMKIDYITAETTATSGYATKGEHGGDGGMTLGDASAVLESMTSLDRNLNERGYSSYLVDSPATDENWSPNPATPEWDYRVVYEAWVDAAIFGGRDPDAPWLEYVHASPAKSSNDTLTVTEGECPPEWTCDNPDGCSPGTGEPPPPDTGMCVANEYGEGCFNGRDDDCDGLADCDDGDCDAKCCIETADCAAGEICNNNMCVPEVPID